MYSDNLSDHDPNIMSLDLPVDYINRHQKLNITLDLCGIKLRRMTY